LGPVFRAYEPDRDRLVAVKLFRLELPPERIRQLVVEFERLIAARLTHAGIAAPLAAGMDGNVAYLVQEFTAADSLDIVIRDYGPAPPADALRLAVQLAGALDFAAAGGVEHGALHPRDVLISSDEMRMTGLGIARALERVGVTPPVRRPYSAPERMGGTAWDQRADIFSLAVLLHEMLWGCRIAGTGQQAADGLIEIAGGDHAALGAAFARALADDPADRFPTALEFASALKSGFTGLEQPTVDARPPTVDSRQSTLNFAVPEPEFRAAEAARYQDVESGPAHAPVSFERPVEPERTFWAPPEAVDVPLESPVALPAPGLLRGYAAEPVSALERSRSAMWPLALALIVGIALGFGAGYGVGSRDRVIATIAGPSAAAPAPAVAAGREFTESAVNEPPKPTPAAAVRLPAQSAVEGPFPSASEGKPHTTGTGKPDATRGAKSAATGEGKAVDAGRLLVKSTPAGAQVFVDGRDHGRTPTTIRDLSRGSHRVRLVHEGYATEERRVVVNPAHATLPVVVAMTRTRAGAPRAAGPAARPAGSFVGTLSVESRPAGAKVFLDGKLAGTTPLMLPQVGAGEHAVRLEHDGYHRWSSSVRVVSGERNRVTASLEK
jgi:hypothetical protein